MAVKEIPYLGKYYTIHYEIINPRARQNFIVLHGWGSNKELMKSAFKDTLKSHRHIYIDMPGFGKSPCVSVLGTKGYKEIINLFLEALGAHADIVAGHSFGGKVATLMNPDLLVLLSSAGIPVEKSWQVKIKIKIFKLFKRFGLGKFRTMFASSDVTGMSQDMYETFKNVVDEDFSDVFAHYKGKALLFWGKSDSATPLFFTGEKIASLISGSKLYPLQGDHYFFMQNARTIGDIITEELHG